MKLMDVNEAFEKMLSVANEMNAMPQHAQERMLRNYRKWLERNTNSDGMVETKLGECMHCGNEDILMADHCGECAGEEVIEMCVEQERDEMKQQGKKLTKLMTVQEVIPLLMITNFPGMGLGIITGDSLIHFAQMAVYMGTQLDETGRLKVTIAPGGIHCKVCKRVVETVLNDHCPECCSKKANNMSTKETETIE